ncbi:DUF3794 domain-containing protein [Salimicrobium halophilum]|uniref:Uncharacterized protein n=1 Tax=Salimicrobium halophilum TaxID=86666 RepID=A0A1G8UHW6_9BACI|nr:DUF3794 domain-containing protein [Salimicrobium halophilum]SDJ53329.1 hypothetical protein SAMN04490247_2273 [Salimicrobium halophilum]
MALYSQLLGIGAGGEVLTALVDVDWNPKSKEATFKIKNTSPATHPSYCIHQVAFNLSAENCEVTEVSPSNFQVHHKEGFHYVLEDSTGKGLHNGEKLTCKVVYKKGWEEAHWLDAPMTSINEGLGVHVAASFKNETDPYTERIGGHFKSDKPKHKCPKPTPPVTTTPAPPRCPIANPQSCCQIVIEGKTQLVPPALFNPVQPEQYPVTHHKTFDVAIEKVCPEKVVICGTVHKTISYKTLEKDYGSVKTVDHYVKDAIPFQCVIDREDANENDEFEIVGAAFMCDVFAEPKNFGAHPDFPYYPVAWKFVEKEILKVCIRKVDASPKPW